jgi:hypothetical protein
MERHEPAWPLLVHAGATGGPPIVHWIATGFADSTILPEGRFEA